MSEVKVTFVYSDEGDWIGMYIDEKLYRQGHSLGEEEVARGIIEMIPVENTIVESRENWDGESQGQLPEKFGDIQWKQQ
jgi:hypothetical protein